MPAKSAAKKAAKKSSAKVHKGKSLGSVKPLKDMPTESVSFNFTKLQTSYKPQGS
jgi:type VI protein secretion system component Hcp